MRMFTYAVLAGAVLVATPSVAPAQRDIVVQPEAVSVQRWSARVSRALDQNLVYPRPDFGRPDPEGVVRVDFRCSEDGKPSHVAVSRPSGTRRLDVAALRAVNRLKTLHPLPTGIGHDQRYAAMIIFAASEESRDRKLRALAKEARTAGPGGRTTVALVGPVPAVGG